MPRAGQIARATLDLVAGIPAARDPLGMAAGHAVWMLRRASAMADECRAQRWVGYAHALIVMHGLARLDELRALVRACAAAEERGMRHRIGRRIAGIRRARGLGQRELARRLGWSHGQLKHIEAGRSEPHAGQLWRISRALGCRVDAILSAAEEE